MAKYPDGTEVFIRGTVVGSQGTVAYHMEDGRINHIGSAHGWKSISDLYDGYETSDMGTCERVHTYGYVENCGILGLHAKRDVSGPSGCVNWQPVMVHKRHEHDLEVSSIGNFVTCKGCPKTWGIRTQQ